MDTLSVYLGVSVKDASSLSTSAVFFSSATRAKKPVSKRLAELGTVQNWPASSVPGQRSCLREVPVRRRRIVCVELVGVVAFGFSSAIYLLSHRECGGLILSPALVVPRLFLYCRPRASYAGGIRRLPLFFFFFF